MRINILHLKEGALKARGLVVIIDVFRAFSTACYLYAQGAKLIIPVNNVSKAFHLKQANPHYILVGERGGAMITGFDYGNSPSAVIQEDFTAKTIVLTTSSGTLGLYNAPYADEIITGSFVNAEGIIRYINKQQPKELSLVCMGNSGKMKAEEDVYLAEYLQATLLGKKYDFNKIKKDLRTGSGKRFFDTTISHSPVDDFNLCLDLNRFSFVLKYDPKTMSLKKQ